MKPDVWQPGDVAGLAERLARSVAKGGGVAWGEDAILGPVVNAIDRLTAVGNRARAWEMARAALGYALLQGWLTAITPAAWSRELGYEATEAWWAHERGRS